MFSGLMSRWTNPPLVGVAERLRHIGGDPDRFLHRELDLAPEPVAEALALDVGHHVIEEAVGLARVVERQDVWMLQAGGDLHFPEEPLGAE
jgi:hypothetical protein